MIRGKLDQAADVYSFSGEEVWVYSTKPQLTVAIDGEIVKIKTPLKCRVDKHALNIMVSNNPGAE